MGNRWLLALVVTSLVGCVDSERPSSSPDLPFSLVERVDEAEARFDENLFRSARKDGRFVNAVTFEGRTELSLTPPLPSRLRYRLRVPEAPILRFATGAASLGDAVLASPLELKMFLESDGVSTEVFSDLFRRRAANRWRDHEVDLSPWAGREVELVLESEWKTSREVRQPVLASWGDPVVASGEASARKPHLVLISIDCLRADHVSAYGYEHLTTPNIDAVGREGTVFENVYATASWTLPTHMSMLTGLLPSFHGATKWEKLSSSVPYLPELLTTAGYRTSGVVSWVYLSQTYGFERGFESYRVLDEPEASDIVDVAIDELRRGEGQSQFLFLHLYDPHWPYLPPRDLIDKFGPRPADISDLLEKTRMGGAPTSASEVEEIIRLYDSEIAFADRELGRFFQALKDIGIYDDTLVVVTSDHGEAFYEHGHWQHSITLYDEVTHVPLIVKWPESQERDGRSAELFSQADIFVTLAEAAGIELPETEEEGFLIRRSLHSSAQTSRSILSEMTWRSPNGTFMKVSFRDETFKYVATLSGAVGDDLGVSEVTREELYDLEADPEEQRNLLPGDASLASPFRGELRAFLDAAKAARSLRNGEAVELDDATLEKLRSLGYTH